MLDFEIKKDSSDCYLSTSLSGKPLLAIPQLNKGTAFTAEERHEFGLKGKLPSRVETLEEQTARVYQQFQNYKVLSNRNAYLNQLLDSNQTLFYKLVREHIEEMLPTVYTPIVGSTVTSYNRRFLTPRGLYISAEDQNDIEEILDNRTNPEIKLIVVSDGESVLGIGDQGIGAMAIPIAKLMVYTAFGGINPSHTLPILLDAGTNNQELLSDPLYLGLRKPRIEGSAYITFIDKFIQAVKKKFPKVFLHWEDFGRTNAYRNLIAYRDELCTFNDDIQGTGIVAVAAVLSACKTTSTQLKDQRIVIFGGGTAGMGVADAIFQTLVHNGLSTTEARQKFWIVDRFGLVNELAHDITPAQQPYQRQQNEIKKWSVQNEQNISLLEVVRAVKPTILIGTSAQTGAFSEEIVAEVAKHTQQPLIMPLSNPNNLAEATPIDIIRWSDGRALVATGSPFEDVIYNQQNFPISQCNNFLAFPGLGLGITAVAATHLSQNMLITASKALAQYSHENSPGLLPRVKQIEAASIAIAIAVAKAAIEEGYASYPIEGDVGEFIRAYFWQPHYLPYRRK